MESGVIVMTRRANHAEETLVIRDGELLAVLPEGDPLRFWLQLPPAELRSMRQSLGPVLDARPDVRRVLEAIIEYKERTVAAEGGNGYTPDGSLETGG